MSNEKINLTDEEFCTQYYMSNATINDSIDSISPSENFHEVKLANACQFEYCEDTSKSVAPSKGRKLPNYNLYLEFCPALSETRHTREHKDI